MAERSGVIPPGHLPRPSRRHALRLGYSTLLGLGLGLRVRASVTAPSPPGQPRARSVLFVFLTGGPGHIDSFDPKPDAPENVRGGLKAISTRVPGVSFSELMPELALRADRFALVRTMAFAPSLAVHELATPLLLAGRNTLPPGVGLAASRNDWPCYAAGLDAARRGDQALPSGITLPNGLSSYAGQNAGLLGPRHDPWRLDLNLNSPDLTHEQVGIAPELSADRMRGRTEFLSTLDAELPNASSASAQVTDLRDDALKLMREPRLARAFLLRNEDPRLRDRYGRNAFGQSLLLARRFLDVGFPFIQVNMGFTAQWDFHAQNEVNARRLFPMLDRAFATLLDDLASTGALDETFLMVAGEFGRTPLINQDAGRDHWTEAFSALFAGAGVQGGLVLGKTDRLGAYPLSTTYSPADLGATIYTMLGVDPATEFRDMSGRVQQLNEGRFLSELFGAGI